MDKDVINFIRKIHYSDLIGGLMVLTGVIGLISPFAKVTASSKLNIGGTTSYSYSIFLYEISDSSGRLEEISNVLLFLFAIYFAFSVLYLMLRGINFGVGVLQVFTLSIAVISFGMNLYLVSSNIKSLYQEPWYLDSSDLLQFQQFFSVSTSFGLCYYLSWLTVLAIAFAPFRYLFLNLIKYIYWHLLQKSKKTVAAS